MSLKLGKLGLKELRKLQSDIEREVSKRSKKNVVAAKKELEAVARRHGVSLDEILPSAVSGQMPKKTARKKAKIPAKYRNPNDPAQTWTGRGRPPLWIIASREAGTKDDALLID